MTHDELEKRIEQFNSLSLPGQPMSMHMGTSYLVSDLWKEVLRLRAAGDAMADASGILRNKCIVADVSGDLGDQVTGEAMDKVLAAIAAWDEETK
jgi:hypothetical protein